MRILFTVHPMFGHFHAMAPLAQALKNYGHEVAFATGAGFGPVLQRLGFQHFPCGFDFDGSVNIFEALPEWETIQKKMPPGPAQQLCGFVEGLAPKMVDDLLKLGNTWRPDLIVRDPVEFGGYIAAESWGLPHATVTWAVYIAAKLAVGEALLELRQRYDLPADPELNSLDRYLVLDFLPASWTFPNWPPPPVTYRYCAPPFDLSSEARLPDWLNSLPSRPTVYATLGTTFNQSPETFQAILTALGGENLNVIITVGRTMNPVLFQPPANVKVEQYIPQTLILPHCDAIIFHGGYNSLLSAIWHGLPMVVMPMGGGDQLPTAIRCDQLGVGIQVDGQPPEAEAIRNAVKTVLTQPAYRARTQQLQREIKALPDLSEAVKRLEILVRTREPQHDQE